MYARVATAQIKPGRLEEAICLYWDSVAPTSREQHGFRGLYLLSDPETNTLTSIGLYEAEADLEAGEAGGYVQAQIAKFYNLLAAPPMIRQYKVAVCVEANQAGVLV